LLQPGVQLLPQVPDDAQRNVAQQPIVGGSSNALNRHRGQQRQRRH
jgi:hypothetical protein